MLVQRHRQPQAMSVENNLHLQQLIALPLNTMDHEEHYGLSPAQIKGLELRLGEARVITLLFMENQYGPTEK